MIVVSGQVKRETCVRSTGLALRQMGDQEVDIVRMVEGITKYAVVVWEPETIRYHLEKALYLATHGRPGPTWVDIPIDVQGAQIDPDKLAGFDPAKETIPSPDLSRLDDDIAVILDKIRSAKRPVIYPGTGIRLSGQYETFLQILEKLGVPVTPAFNSSDLLWENHPCYAGLPGTIGNRAGNFAVQNADFLLVLGSRLNIRAVSYNWQNFARGAFKAIVDIDPLELQKPMVRPDLPVHADLADFLPRLLAATSGWHSFGAQGLDDPVQDVARPLPRRPARILENAGPGQSLLLCRCALRPAQRKGRHRHRRRHGIRLHVPGGQDQARAAALSQFGQRADGLRCAGRARGSGRAGRKATCDLSRGRRQHHDEFAGARRRFVVSACR